MTRLFLVFLMGVWAHTLCAEGIPGGKPVEACCRERKVSPLRQEQGDLHNKEVSQGGKDSLRQLQEIQE